MSSFQNDVDIKDHDGSTTGLKLAGTLVTTTAAELNVMDGVTATAAELNYNDIAVLGTGAASKAVVLDAGDDYTWPAAGVLTYGVLNDGTTALGATAAELNANDISAQAETIDSGVAISVLVANTKVDNTTSGAGAITLAAPDASMYGRVKTVEMTVDGGDVTLALTNVQGGTAATTATFGDVNDALVMVGGTSKWHVIGESGVVLS